MNNITIGQYIHGHSWLHKMDPRIKIISLIFLLVTVFLVPISSNPYAVGTMLFLVFFSLTLTKSSKIPLGKVLRGLRPLVFLLTFTFFIQLFYERGTQYGTILDTKNHLSLITVLIIVGLIVLYNVTKKRIPFRILYFILTVAAIFAIQSINALNIVNFYSYDFIITGEGLLKASFLFLRIVTVIILTSLLTFTTTTTDINFGMEALMSPLKLIKVPVEIIAMMLSLTLRYIPTLLEETEKIMKAQASRGVDFNESKLKEKIVQIISLLIPIFVISFKRAEDLGNAMEARGYIVGQKRTRIDQFKISVGDYFIISMAVLLLAGMILARVYVL